MVILDEPFSRPRPGQRQRLREAVLELRKRGATVIFSTHDMSVAEQMCDCIFMIFGPQGARRHARRDPGALRARHGARAHRGGRAALDGQPGVEAVSDYGNLQEVRLTADPQAFLARLIARTAVFHFEVTRPSLHDIFVRIAQPDADAGRIAEVGR